MKRTFALGNTIFIILVILNQLWNNVLCKQKQFHASIQEMELLFETENKFISFIELYLKKEHERLQKVEKLIEDFLPFDVVESKEPFLNNIFNRFHLIKYFVGNVNPIFTLMNSPSFTDSYINKTFIFPTNDDLHAVYVAINNLMKVYNISPSQMVTGEVVYGMKSVLNMSACDCFNMGTHLSKNNYYLKAVKWYSEGLHVEDKEVQKTFPRLKLLQNLAFGLQKIGNYSGALSVLTELLKIDPSNHKARQDFNYFTDYFRKGMNDPIAAQKPSKIPLTINTFANDMNNYERLCRNEILLDQTVTSHLNCYYFSEASFLILQPVKVEEVHRIPWVAIIYDIVSDKYIKILTNLSKKSLQRAGVSGQTLEVSYRISKNMWLKDTDHPVILKLSRFLQEITGMNVLHGAELLQMNNYGIGGKYDPHYDFALLPIERNKKHNLGDRIATVLLYLSNVKAGGNTVFPKLKIGVKPVKGSAVFWYNLLKQGMGDLTTIHAGCPVLSGNKWVANKWILINPQMFQKPCGKSEFDTHFQKFR